MVFFREDIPCHSFHLQLDIEYLMLETKMTILLFIQPKQNTNFKRFIRIINGCQGFITKI